MSMLAWLVIAPLASAFVITLAAGRVRGVAQAVSIAVSAWALCGSLAIARAVSVSQAVIFKSGATQGPLSVVLRADGFSALMLIVINAVALLSLLYAFGYMRRYTAPWKFYALYSLMLCGLNGVVVSSDLFSLYIFLELASISAYALVAFGVESEHLEASFKYAILGSLASIFILLGIALLYSYSGTLAMADLPAALSAKPHGVLISFVSVLFFTGFGLKAALVPFHAWLPDAHSSAPTPVSATLSGIVIKTVGVYALCRVFFNCIGVSSSVLMVMMVLGLLSMVAGALLALTQTDSKRMFAYSSISQVGYIVFALGVGTPLAVLGGLFHLVNHAFFKSLLFLNAGAVEYATGTRDLRRMGGLGRVLPVTGGTSLVGSMAIAGIPPFGGFWSKLTIILAALQAGYLGYAIIAVLVSILTLAYYLKFQSFAFYGACASEHDAVREVPMSMKTAMIILALISALLGVLLLPWAKPFLLLAVQSLVPLAKGSL
jgi:multicomponent Na+:H+ antiporter subunit D